MSSNAPQRWYKYKNHLGTIPLAERPGDYPSMSFVFVYHLNLVEKGTKYYYFKKDLLIYDRV